MIDDIPWCEVLVKDLVAVLKEIEEHVIRFCKVKDCIIYKRQWYSHVKLNIKGRVMKVEDLEWVDLTVASAVSFAKHR
jgi:hypothetical protein